LVKSVHQNFLYYKISVQLYLPPIPQKGNLNNKIDMKSLFKFPFLGNGWQVYVQQSLFITNRVYNKSFFWWTIKCTTKIIICDRLKRKFVSQYDKTF
jgi:hypothetical protein